MIQNRNQNNSLCAIVFDSLVYLDPKFLVLKTKKQPYFFSEVRGLSRKAFATNMYGLAVIVSVPILDICQILMR